VTDALNLDGGGSTTLCMADPMPRVVNVPVGRGDAPGTLRAVGSSLAVFAAVPGPPASVPSGTDVSVGTVTPALGQPAIAWKLAWGGLAILALLVAMVVWMHRQRSNRW
jgi:hypothetical protein